MPERDGPDSPVTADASRSAASPAAAGWQPVGGALAASVVIHALALASLVALLVHHEAPSTPAAVADSHVLTAILTGGPAAAQARTNDADAQVAAVAPAATLRAPAPVPPPDRQSSPAPWSAIPVDVALPPALFGQAMTSEGVEWFETANLVALGGDLEAKILRDYPVRPDAPVLLKPAASIGYPLDALGAGVEGRVLVWFGVAADGSIIDKEALDGPPELMEWVLERVDRLVERPALIADRPVRGWIALEVHFSRASAEEARARAAAVAIPKANATVR
jgi:outer membrane biosynthesis protein TonB